MTSATATHISSTKRLSLNGLPTMYREMGSCKVSSNPRGTVAIGYLARPRRVSSAVGIERSQYQPGELNGSLGRRSQHDRYGRMIRDGRDDRVQIILVEKLGKAFSAGHLFDCP